MTARLLLLLSVSSACQLFGQSAELSGFVRDPANAAVPRASIEVRNQDDGTRQTATTNDDGVYLVVGLKPGSYQVTGQAKGFKTLTRDNVVLEVAQRARLDLQLELGALEEKVSVTADVTLLNSTDASV